MAALDRDRLCGAIRSDDGFYFHASLELHTTGKAGILRNDTRYNLATAFRFLRPAEARRENTTTKNSGQYGSPRRHEMSVRSFRRLWKITAVTFPRGTELTSLEPPAEPPPFI